MKPNTKQIKSSLTWMLLRLFITIYEPFRYDAKTSIHNPYFDNKIRNSPFK